jgi:hypothetical protein
MTNVEKKELVYTATVNMNHSEENPMDFFQKLNIKLPCDPAILLLGRIDLNIWQETLSPNIHCSIIYNCQNIEAI